MILGNQTHECLRRLKVSNRTGPLDAGSYLKDELVQFEQEMLHEAMTRADGVQTRAAHMLGISPQLLRYKLKKHGILQ